MTAAALLVAAVASCTKTPKYPKYSPHENLLSIAAEYQLLASRDPYRQEPAEELTGQNIARATLVRLANYRTLHPGRFGPEVRTLEGRAFEFLMDYESARTAYREAATFDTELRPDCLRRVSVLDEFIRRARLSEEETASVESTIRALAQQAAEFRRFATSVEDPFYASLARCEAEQSEISRAELLATNRWLMPGGETQALEALSSLVSDHTESKRALEHALRLARFHRELAEEEMRLRPPTTLDFDRNRFVQHVDAALDLLHRVSQADGRPERIVAARELDAVLALREMVLARAD